MEKGRRAGEVEAKGVETVAAMFLATALQPNREYVTAVARINSPGLIALINARRCDSGRHNITIGIISLPARRWPAKESIRETILHTRKTRRMSPKMLEFFGFAEGRLGCCILSQRFVGWEGVVELCGRRGGTGK